MEQLDSIKSGFDAVMRLTRVEIETDGHQKHHRLSSSIFLSAAILDWSKHANSPGESYELG